VFAMARMIVILSWVLAAPSLEGSPLNENGMNGTCARERDEGSWLQVRRGKKLSAKLSAEFTAADRAASAFAETEDYTTQAVETVRFEYENFDFDFFSLEKLVGGALPPEVSKTLGGAMTGLWTLAGAIISGARGDVLATIGQAFTGVGQLVGLIPGFGPILSVVFSLFGAIFGAFGEDPMQNMLEDFRESILQEVVQLIARNDALNALDAAKSTLADFRRALDYLPIYLAALNKLNVTNETRNGMIYTKYDSLITMAETLRSRIFREPESITFSVQNPPESLDESIEARLQEFEKFLRTQGFTVDAAAGSPPRAFNQLGAIEYQTVWVQMLASLYVARSASSPNPAGDFSFIKGRLKDYARLLQISLDDLSRFQPLICKYEGAPQNDGTFKWEFKSSEGVIFRDGKVVNKRFPDGEPACDKTLIASQCNVFVDGCGEFRLSGVDTGTETDPCEDLDKGNPEDEGDREKLRNDIEGRGSTICTPRFFTDMEWRRGEAMRAIYQPFIDVIWRLAMPEVFPPNLVTYFRGRKWEQNRLYSADFANSVSGTFLAPCCSGDPDALRQLPTVFRATVQGGRCGLVPISYQFLSPGNQYGIRLDQRSGKEGDPRFYNRDFPLTNVLRISENNLREDITPTHFYRSSQGGGWVLFKRSNGQPQFNIGSADPWRELANCDHERPANDHDTTTLSYLKLRIDAMPEDPNWRRVFAKGSFGDFDAGKDLADFWFNQSYLARRHCASCGLAHQKLVYYLRVTDYPQDWSFYDNFLFFWSSKNNVLNRDFYLFDEDSRSKTAEPGQFFGKPFQFCNYFDEQGPGPGTGAFRDCGLNQPDEGNSFGPGFGQPDVKVEVLVLDDFVPGPMQPGEDPPDLLLPR